MLHGMPIMFLAFSNFFFKGSRINLRQASEVSVSVSVSVSFVQNTGLRFLYIYIRMFLCFVCFCLVL